MSAEYTDDTGYTLWRHRFDGESWAPEKLQNANVKDIISQCLFTTADDRLVFVSRAPEETMQLNSLKLNNSSDPQSVETGKICDQFTCGAFSNGHTLVLSTKAIMHQFRTWSPADGQLQDWQVEVGAIHATIYSKPVKESKCEGENKNEENGMPTEEAENTRFEDVVFEQGQRNLST